MAFDIAKLTRLSGPLSIIYPQTDQSQYWGYRTTDALSEITTDGFFPSTSGLLPGDAIWVFLSDGGTPASYSVVILNVVEDT